MSSLDHSDVHNIYVAARQFVWTYERFEQEPANGLRVAGALASLGALEAAVDINVSRETAALEAKLDADSQKPPF